ncbi:uroporphyrinogen-III synthase [Hydrogenophaga pseudoflava]|uniref:uroporphyrinogen-III synthase n=1 Tax=Hydrogenophaga pseudoflava TaxID=47421 RepID=UPI0027E4126B|nr:uroporphyrinogen-III synthase [Hydrogenophaga pseudoflava]MDQ7743276.1 uroporphyrinogen-III synthase [Hydrogenophaga pseudoflava]
MPSRWSRVIVTRPAGEAAAWVAALQAQGWAAYSLPLIDIGTPRDPQVLARLRHAQSHWSHWDALMFVSSAAVQHFFDGVVADGEAHQAGTRFWAPGPGTARVLAEALQRLGLGPDRVDQPPADAPQFDSEHLWPVVSSQARPGARVLVVRGVSAAADGALAGGAEGNGREWLLEQCRARGAQVDTCAAYERHAPRWSASDRTLAVQDGLWLFSSSEAVAHLQTAMPATDWSRAAALCTHERIAAAARAAGFVQVHTSRPALADVLLALESMRSPT